MIMLSIDNELYQADSIIIRNGRMVLTIENYPPFIVRPLDNVWIEGMPTKLDSDGTVPITIVPRKDVAWIG